MLEKGKRRSRQILCVITGCGGGDWPPLLALAIDLHHSGHDLMVVCDVGTLEAVQASGLKALYLPQSLDLVTFFEPALAHLLSRKENFHQESANPLLLWGQSSVGFIKTQLKGWHPSLVVTSLLGVGLGELLAKEYAVRRCFLNPSFDFGHSAEQLRSTDFSEMGAQMYRQWIVPLVKTAELVLHATDREFDLGPRAQSTGHEYVGPMFWERTGENIEFIKKPGPPWVLVTLSTSPQPGDLTIVKTAMRALAAMDVRVLVTLATGHDKNDLGPISDQIQVMGYIPHSQVLPHCCLVISHAGHGIVMKSMVHGVPMVLVPWGRDQPGVAARAKRMGTAVVVPGCDCSVEALALAVKTIFADPGYRVRSQEVSSRLGNPAGGGKAVHYIEQLLLGS